MIETGCSDKKP